MTDTELALLRTITGAGLTDPEAIRAARADDTPRLALADYWEENGQEERAEFVRVQCGLARRFPEHHGFPADKSLMSEDDARLDLISRNLMSIHGDGWFPPPAPGCHGLVSRGFVSRVYCSWKNWHTHAATILERHPIERVKLTTWPEPDELRQIGTASLAVFWWPRDNPYHMRSSSASAVSAAIRNAFDGMARVRWPGIEFELPNEFSAEWDHLSTADQLFARAREAGRRSAMEHNRRVLDAILRPHSQS